LVLKLSKIRCILQFGAWMKRERPLSWWIIIPEEMLATTTLYIQLHQNDRKVRCELCAGCFRSCIDTKVEGLGCNSETWAWWTMPKIDPQLYTLHGHIYIYISLWEMVKMTFVMERLIISVLEWSTCFSCDNPCAWTLGKMICAIKIKQKSCMYAFSEMQIHHFTCRRKVCASGYDYWRGWWHQLWSHNLRCFLFVYRL
jgi:hypothetical protein